MRLAMASEYFCIAGSKDVLHVHAFQMRTTVSSGSFDASATIRQPETRLPWGRTPNPLQDRNGELNVHVTRELGLIGGAMGRDGLHGRRLPAPFGNLLSPTGERSWDSLTLLVHLLTDKDERIEVGPGWTGSHS